jgi:putative lipoprotein
MDMICGQMSNGVSQTYANSRIACSDPRVMGYHLGACPNQPTPAKHSQIAGKVTFKNNAPLPAGSIVTVTLEDNSIADKAAEIISKQVIHGAKSFPIKFTIPYKTKLISPALIQHPIGYGVHVRIEKQGKLLFINDTFTPAFGIGAINLPVIQVN